MAGCTPDFSFEYQRYYYHSVNNQYNFGYAYPHYFNHVNAGSDIYFYPSLTQPLWIDVTDGVQDLSHWNWSADLLQIAPVRPSIVPRGPTPEMKGPHTVIVPEDSQESVDLTDEEVVNLIGEWEQNFCDKFLKTFFTTPIFFLQKHFHRWHVSRRSTGFKTSCHSIVDMVLIFSHDRTKIINNHLQ